MYLLLTTGDIRTLGSEVIPEASGDKAGQELEAQVRRGEGLDTQGHGHVGDTQHFWELRRAVLVLGPGLRDALD